MNILVSAIGQGLLWATLGIGLFLTFRILDFPDMTVEGTFPLGAATAVTLISNGMNPGLASLIAAGAGALAGLVTGLIYTKGKVPILLAGILTMTAVYSINLRIMGQANRSLLGKGTLFSADFLDFLPKNFPTVVVGLVIIVVVTAATAIFLQTELGQAFIVTGDNRAMARSLGVNTDNMTIMGLMPQNFFPNMDKPYLRADCFLPEGYSIRETEKEMGKIEEFLLQQEEVVNVSATYGSSPLRYYLASTSFGPKSNFGNFLVEVKDKKYTAQVEERLNKYVRENYPDILIRSSLFKLFAGSGSEYRIRFYRREYRYAYDVDGEGNEYHARM